MLEPFFIVKLQGEGLQYNDRCFPVNFAKYLKTLSL